MQIDLAQTIPNLLSDALREAAQQAYKLAADPLNKLDDNPFITREWVLVGEIMSQAARILDQRLEAMFHE